MRRNPKTNMGDMSYREMSHKLAKTEEALVTLRGKYKTSLANRRDLTEQLLEVFESSSSNEANIGALVDEVEKLNEEKTKFKRELEALTIQMSQELEARRVAEDKIKEKENEILKINQENDTLYAHRHEEKEEKEEIKAKMDMEMSLRETLMKRNEDLTKELPDANEKLAKFNKSSTMIDEQIQSQRMNDATIGLGYNTFEKGESPVLWTTCIKVNLLLRFINPPVRNPISLFVSIVINQDILLMFVEEDLMLLMVIDLVLINDISLELLIVIFSLATCMDIELLSAGMEQIMIPLT